MAGCDAVVNFAAETHVDRSLLGDATFIETDVRGVFVLLEEARRVGVRRFVQISTDEVYGTILERAVHGESTPQPPQPLLGLEGRRRPARLLLLGLLRRAGDRHPRLEQLRPLPVPREADPALRHERASTTCPLPLYGDGRNVRDWLFVEDHAAAVDFLLERATRARRTTSPAGTRPRTSRSRGGCSRMLGKPESLIRYVDDRPGHDRRYSLDAGKLARLGCSASTPFERGSRRTVRWYRESEDWWRPIKERDAQFKEWYQKNYAERLATSKPA